jgi:hypothetical protein
MAFVNPATAGITVGAVDSHHLLGLYLHGVLLVGKQS